MSLGVPLGVAQPLFSGLFKIPNPFVCKLGVSAYARQELVYQIRTTISCQPTLKGDSKGEECGEVCVFIFPTKPLEFTTTYTIIQVICVNHLTIH